MRRSNDHGEPFGARLMVQKGREGLIGQLVEAAKDDHGFPRDGDLEAVRKRLRDNYAEGDLFEVLDDAKTDWLAY